MKNFLAKPAIILIVTAITLLFVISLQKTAQKSHLSQRNVEVLEQKIQAISGNIQEEKKAIEFASSEFSKERILRNELLLQKPGEYILQISLEEKELEQTEETSPQTPWEAWKALFGL